MSQGRVGHDGMESRIWRKRSGGEQVHEVVVISVKNTCPIKRNINRIIRKSNEYPVLSLWSVLLIPKLGPVQFVVL